MNLYQHFTALLFALVVALVLGACVPQPQPYTVSAYSGIAHDQTGRVWLTGVTTLHGSGPPSTKTWIQVCTQDPMTTAPRLLCQPVQLVSGVFPQPLSVVPPDLDKDDGGEDGEEEDEDKVTPPKAKGHPLDPNRKPVDEDL